MWSGPLQWVGGHCRNKVVEYCATLLATRQLGYGIGEGAEAAVHAARLFLTQL